ncbi:hypothetical protein PG984_006586 [Apiospora sp. TS-2023a]
MAASDLSAIAASPNFQGFYLAGGKTQAITLSSDRTYTSTTVMGPSKMLSLAGYIDQTTTLIYTNASGAYLTALDSSSMDCTGSWTIISMTILNHQADAAGYTYLDCRQTWRANTIYRTLDVANSATCKVPRSSSGTEKLANAKAPTPYYVASKSDTATTPATPQSSAAIPSPSSTDKGSPSAPASSQAWIAGAVVGPVVGCALVGLLVWWIMRHRMKKAAAAAAAGPTPVTTAESARHVSSTYSQYQPGPHWSTSPPPPAAMYGGEVPAHGWGPQKPSSPPPVSGGSPAPLHELSSDPGNVDHNVRDLWYKAGPPALPCLLAGRNARVIGELDARGKIAAYPLRHAALQRGFVVTRELPGRPDADGEVRVDGQPALHCPDGPVLGARDGDLAVIIHVLAVADLVFGHASVPDGRCQEHREDGASRATLLAVPDLPELRLLGGVQDGKFGTHGGRF